MDHEERLLVILDTLRGTNTPHVIGVKVIDNYPAGHPFTVGPRHVARAADHHGGMLGEDVCRAIPCAHKGCTANYDEHTPEPIYCVALSDGLTRDEWAAFVKEWKPAAETLGVAGLGFAGKGKDIALLRAIGIAS